MAARHPQKQRQLVLPPRTETEADQDQQTSAMTHNESTVCALSVAFEEDGFVRPSQLGTSLNIKMKPTSRPEQIIYAYAESQKATKKHSEDFSMDTEESNITYDARAQNSASFVVKGPMHVATIIEKLGSSVERNKIKLAKRRQKLAMNCQ